MVTLTDPASAQNTVDRFADYVVAAANANIVFGTNAVPFGVYSSYFPAIFGGTTSGRAIGVTGTSLGGSGALMSASTVYSTLLAETAAYTRIRNLRAILFITGTGYIFPRPNGQASFPTDLRTDFGPIFNEGPGVIYDQANVAHLSSNYQQSIESVVATGVSFGSNANVANLEAFFTNLRTAYNASRANTITQQENVCHASCHTNCHSSRGRR